jgi:hypothetical protein
MNIVESFISADDPSVECIIVWTGTAPLLPVWASASSLQSAATRQPAKRVSSARAPIASAAMRA